MIYTFQRATVILVLSTLFVTSIVLSSIVFVLFKQQQNTKDIISDVKNKLDAVKSDVTKQLNITDQNNRFVLKEISDSVHNTNNETTQQFFDIAQHNAMLIQQNNALLRDVLGNITKN